MQSAAPAPAAPKPLLTYREAAEALGVSERSIYGWVKSEQIASTRLGRLVRIRRDEVERVAREGISTQAG